MYDPSMPWDGLSVDPRPFSRLDAKAPDAKRGAAAYRPAGTRALELEDMSSVRAPCEAGAHERGGDFETRRRVGLQAGGARASPADRPRARLCPRQSSRSARRNCFDRREGDMQHTTSAATRARADRRSPWHQQALKATITNPAFEEDALIIDQPFFRNMQLEVPPMQATVTPASMHAVIVTSERGGLMAPQERRAALDFEVKNHEGAAAAEDGGPAGAASHRGHAHSPR